MKVKIYVEGGAKDQSKLNQECRRGFQEFFINAGFKRPNLPSVIASGGRAEAIKDFISAAGRSTAGEIALLLVDSEEKVGSMELPSGEDARKHLESTDGMVFPNRTTNTQIHLMVVVMESWFLADHDALKKLFSRRLDISKLPSQGANIEKFSKREVYTALEKASKDTPAGGYKKGAHSFKLLGLLNAEKVRKASPWVNRLLLEIEKLLQTPR